MSFKSEEYDYAKRNAWLHSLHKSNIQLERIIHRTPQNLSKTDRLEAMIELDVIIRRASRLEYQLKNLENK